MLRTGDILNGTYEIQERLGAGGGGVIFKAYHLRMQKMVALKLIKDDVKSFIENRSEVDILKNLKNDHLPQVLDFIENGNDIYTVMEFIEGTDFKKLISEGEIYDEKSVRSYALQLCSAVEYLHSQTPPIIHSDIKPANIMLTPDGKICLIDFNISAVSDGNGALSMGGSKGFAAPEQFRRLINAPVNVDSFHEETRFVSEEDATELFNDNKQPTENFSTTSAKTKNVSKAYIDIRTDIYGLGASLYYMISSRVPSGGTLDFRGIKISKKFKSIIEKATAQNPDDRYKNVAEMRKDLEYNGSIKIKKKAIIASAAAIVFLAVSAGIYSYLHIEMNMSEIEDVYGYEYNIQAYKKRTLNDKRKTKVSKKYCATAASAMKALYNYLSTLSIEERMTYIGISPAAIKVLSDSDAEIKVRDPNEERESAGFFGAKLSPDSEDEMIKYIYDNFTNYTGKDELYFRFGYDGAKITYFYIADDERIMEALFENGLVGDVGAAVTDSVTECALSGAEEGSLMISIASDNLAEELNELMEDLSTAFADPKEFDFELPDYVREDGTKIYLYNKNLFGEDFSPLKDIETLETADFSYATGVDITMFNGLSTLKSISFNHSDILNLENAEGFDNVETLDFSDSSLESLTGITAFPKLKSLNISKTNVFGLVGVRELAHLEEIDLSQTNISDISPLSEIPTLKKIYYPAKTSFGNIIDISSLKKLDSLEELDLKDQVMSSPDFVYDIAEIKTLRLLNLRGTKYYDYDNEENVEPDLTPLGALTNLEELDIGSHYYLEDISFLSECRNLKKLYADYCHYEDISALAGCTKMEILHLQSSHITDISPLASMKCLKELDISATDVTDLSPLKDITTLEKLELSNHKDDVVIDLSCLSGNTGMKELRTYGPVSGIDVVKNMTSLENLYLHKTPISTEDTNVLCGMTGLTTLSVDSECISPENLKRLQRALPDCNIMA